MSLFSWLRAQASIDPSHHSARKTSRKATRRPALQRHRLQLESLEDRTVPATFLAGTALALIADINAANKAGGANTIILSSTPGGGPYELTAVNNTQDGANGLPVISGGGRKLAADHLTIVGNGNVIERGSGAPAFRLFDVASGGSLTLQDVTLANGLAYGAGSAAQGGAVRNQGTLVLSDVTVTGNEALGLSYQNNKGSKGSSSGDAAGGGIWSSGALTVEIYSLIQFNIVIGAGAGSGEGGGIAIAGGTATIDSSDILNNRALGGYDAATNTYSPLGPGAGYGGGIAVISGTATLTNDAIQSNSAGSYVDMAFQGFDDMGVGGGIAIASGATVDLDSYTLNSTRNNTGFFPSATTDIYGTYTLLP